MASFQDQLRQRLMQITDNNSEQTTWEQLKAQRERQRQAALEAVGQINAQTDAYRQQLSNYAQMYNSGQVVKPKSSGTSSKKKKSTNKANGSLGDAFGGLAGGLSSIFGG